MPGIYTHNKIFRDTVSSLLKRKKKNYLLKSIESVFSDDLRFKSGLFGSIGPNIFDYIPSRMKGLPFSHELSFLIHNKYYRIIIDKMISEIYESHDKNNEWTSIQRAYLYGFISHAVSDAIIHPYIFYWSGFPSSSLKKEKNHFREQNLLITYNIDNYNIYQAADKSEYRLAIEDMLPLEKNRRIKKVIPPVKDIIFRSVKDILPQQFNDLNILKFNGSGKIPEFAINHFDLLPYYLIMTYKLKHSINDRIKRIILKLRNNYNFYSDFIVKYPDPKRYNSHILNHHRERWQFPAGQIGARHESIDILMSIAVEKTAEIWLALEEGMFDKINLRQLAELNLNLFTGENDKDFFKMQYKNPVKLKLF